jgi:hypothetical protein
VAGCAPSRDGAQGLVRARTVQLSLCAPPVSLQDMEFRERYPAGLPTVDCDESLDAYWSQAGAVPPRFQSQGRWPAGAVAVVGAAMPSPPPRVDIHEPVTSPLLAAQQPAGSAAAMTAGATPPQSPQKGSPLHSPLLLPLLQPSSFSDVCVGQARARHILDQLQADVTLLSSHGLMDYSLLINVMPVTEAPPPQPQQQHGGTLGERSLSPSTAVPHVRPPEPPMPGYAGNGGVDRTPQSSTHGTASIPPERPAQERQAPQGAPPAAPVMPLNSSGLPPPHHHHPRRSSVGSVQNADAPAAAPYVPAVASKEVGSGNGIAQASTPLVRLSSSTTLPAMSRSGSVMQRVAAVAAAAGPAVAPRDPIVEGRPEAVGLRVTRTPLRLRGPRRRRASFDAAAVSHGQLAQLHRSSPGSSGAHVGTGSSTGKLGSSVGAVLARATSDSGVSDARRPVVVRVPPPATAPAKSLSSLNHHAFSADAEDLYAEPRSSVEQRGGEEPRCRLGLSPIAAGDDGAPASSGAAAAVGSSSVPGMPVLNGDRGDTGDTAPTLPLSEQQQASTVTSGASLSPPILLRNYRPNAWSMLPLPSSPSSSSSAGGREGGDVVAGASDTGSALVDALSCCVSYGLSFNNASQLSLADAVSLVRSAQQLPLQIASVGEALTQGSGVRVTRWSPLCVSLCALGTPPPPQVLLQQHQHLQALAQVREGTGS